jgi:hypothetical protein
VLCLGTTLMYAMTTSKLVGITSETYGIHEAISVYKITKQSDV